MKNKKDNDPKLNGNLLRASLSTIGLSERLNQETTEKLAKIAQNIFTGREYKTKLNDFLTSLIDKIGLTLFRNSNIKNEFSEFIYYSKTFGEVIEEIFINPAFAEDYQPKEIVNNGSVDPFRITVPDVKALYICNEIKRKYRVTKFESQLKKAFYSEYGLYNLLENLAQSLINGANLDARTMFKNVLNSAITNQTEKGKISNKPEMWQLLTSTVDNKESATSFILSVKNKISEMMFPSGAFNTQGAIQQLNIDDLVVFLRKDIATLIQTELLSSAFNKEELNFTPAGYSGDVKIVIVDDFGGIEAWNSDGSTKLEKKYDEYGKFIGYTANGADYTDVVTFYNNYMNKQPNANPMYNVCCLIADKRLPIIAIDKDEVYSTFNGEAIYTNTVLHRWATYGYSLFANYCVIFEPHKNFNAKEGGLLGG